MGFGNFCKLLGFHSHEGHLVANDPQFWQYLYNTVFLMGAIPANIFGSLMLAMALNQKIRGRIAFRTIYFLPTVCSGVAICFLWKWLYQPDFGLINSSIKRLGDIFGLALRGPRWLASIGWAKPAIMIMGLWASIGGVNMILFLAALQGIPRDYYEAAEIDGANAWRKFTNITWPLVSPTTFFILVMSVIAGFQGGFMLVYIMTGGGPAGSTKTIEYYIYENAYQWLKMGYGSAIAWILFLTIFIVTLLNWKFGGRHVHYF